MTQITDSEAWNLIYRIKELTYILKMTAEVQKRIDFLKDKISKDNFVKNAVS